jgi:hypothetical protein
MNMVSPWQMESPVVSLVNCQPQDMLWPRPIFSISHSSQDAIPWSCHQTPTANCRGYIGDITATIDLWSFHLYCRRNQNLYVSLYSKQFQANILASITAVDISMSGQYSMSNAPKDVQNSQQVTEGPTSTTAPNSYLREPVTVTIAWTPWKWSDMFQQWYRYNACGEVEYSRQAPEET